MTHRRLHLPGRFLRGEWRDDAAPGEGTDWDYVAVFRVPPGRSWRVRAVWPLALAIRFWKDRLSAQRGPRPDEVSVNLGRPGPLLRPFVRVEYLPRREGRGRDA